MVSESDIRLILHKMTAAAVFFNLAIYLPTFSFQFRDIVKSFDLPVYKPLNTLKQ